MRLFTSLIAIVLLLIMGGAIMNNAAHAGEVVTLDNELAFGDRFVTSASEDEITSHIIISQEVTSANPGVSLIVTETLPISNNPYWQEDIELPPEPDASDPIGLFIWRWLVVALPAMVALEKIIKPYVLKQAIANKDVRDATIIALVIAYSVVATVIMKIDLLSGVSGTQDAPAWFLDVLTTGMIAFGAFFGHAILDFYEAYRAARKTMQP